MNYKSKQDFLDNVHSKFSNEKEFLQAVEEVIGSIWDTVQQSQDYLDGNIDLNTAENKISEVDNVELVVDKHNIDEHLYFAKHDKEQKTLSKYY